MSSPAEFGPAEREKLWQQLEAFDLDGGPCSLSFSARLAREQGWTVAYANRVILEYKRYLFLAVTSATPVCPSEEVDAAWHQHLTYTRSYWKRLCGELLSTPIHHDPTRGGPSEAAKHHVMYEATLARYREAFQLEPPADIWPTTTQRFAAQPTQQLVDLSQHWVIRKQIVQRGLMLAAAILVGVVLPGCIGGNLFDLKGTDFLWVLIPAIVLAVVTGRVLRLALWLPTAQPGDEAQPIAWEQAAYLAGGAPRLTTATITRLVADNVLHITDDRLERGTAEVGTRSAVERAVYQELPIAKDQLKTVQQAVDAAFAPQLQQLEQDGFVISTSQRTLARLISVAPLVVVLLALGLPRLVMGLSDHRPVQFLVMSLIAGGVGGLIVCLSGQRLASRRGQALLDQARQRHTNHADDLTLAVALFGTSVLAGTAMSQLHGWYPRTPAGADSGCGTGCGSSDGGGGGDGGSGCGGCGGGD